MQNLAPEQILVNRSVMPPICIKSFALYIGLRYLVFALPILNTMRNDILVQVNNWAFYIDGERVWTTRHDGVPLVHTTSSLLIGRRHGEHWPAATGRDWRPGAGDRTCFRGHACMLVFYRHALPCSTLRAHYQALLRMTAVAASVKPSICLSQKEQQGDPKMSSAFFGNSTTARTLDPNFEVCPSEARTTGKKNAVEENSSAVISVKLKSVEEAVSTRNIAAQLAISNATHHNPLVWGRSPALATSDLDAFYQSLESNPVWRLTRRALNRPSIHHREYARRDRIPLQSAIMINQDQKMANAAVALDRAEDGLSEIAEAPSDKARQTSLEEAHTRAATALQIVADPGGQGLWERATPYTLAALPHHLARAGDWIRLVSVLRSPYFLGQMLNEYGPDHAITVLAHAAAGAAQTQKNGCGMTATTASCELSLLLELVRFHFREFGNDHRSRGSSMSKIWEHALEAGLPGVEKAAHVIGAMLADSKQLLAQHVPAIAADSSRRLELERVAQRLHLTELLGMGLLVSGGEEAMHRAVVEIEAHLDELADMDVSSDSFSDASINIMPGVQSVSMMHNLLRTEAAGRGRVVGAAATGGGLWGTGKDSAAALSIRCVEDMALILRSMERSAKNKSAKNKSGAAWGVVRIYLRGPFPVDDRAAEAIRAKLLCQVRHPDESFSFSVFLARLEPCWLHEASASLDSSWNILVVLSCRFAIIDDMRMAMCS